MTSDIKWFFAKVTLKSPETFKQRQDELTRRFINSQPHSRKWGKTTYVYELSDVAKANVAGKDCLIGYLNRKPKVAYGRKVDTNKRTSSESKESLPNLYDSTEFVYHLKSCQMAIHERGPFKPSLYTMMAIQSMLSRPTSESKILEGVIHAEYLKDDEYSESLIANASVLSEVKLVYSKPNPGSGDDDLDKIDFGLISEESNADQSTIIMTTESGGTLDKSENGFIRRSIRGLLSDGYMQKGVIVVDGNKHDIQKSGARTLKTSGYIKLPTTTTSELLTRTRMWMNELKGKWPFTQQSGEEDTDQD